jgi:hypothetical protein
LFDWACNPRTILLLALLGFHRECSTLALRNDSASAVETHF